MTINQKIASFEQQYKKAALSHRWLQQVRPVPASMELSYPAARILSQLSFASNLSAVNHHAYDDVIHAALDHLRAGADAEGGVITRSLCEATEKMLEPLREAAHAYRVHLVAHAHIDMDWMWDYAETANVTVDTVRTMLDLMEEYPKFTFSQSQAAVYEILEKYAPTLLARVKARVKEGRWEVAASTWVEGDKNIVSGESLIRQHLYAKRYLSRMFDLPAEAFSLDFEPDTFGHAATVPTACRSCGVRYYYYNRGTATPEFAHVWRAPNGDELLAWRDPHSYGSMISYQLFAAVPCHCEKYGSKEYLGVYGVSDHGGGPTRQDLNRLADMESWTVAPTLIYSTYSAFFAELEKVRDTLPVHHGEMNYIFTGCYTSQSRLKQGNHQCEDQLAVSEMLSAAAHVWAGAPRINDIHQKAWCGVLFNQFHDILDGSCVTASRESAMARYREALAAASVSAGNAMRSIADAIDTSGFGFSAEPMEFSSGAGVGFHAVNGFPCTERGVGNKRIFHLFNSTAYDFDGVVSLSVWDWSEDASMACFADSHGVTIPSMLLADDASYWRHYYKTFALRVKIPAFGYATYTLTPKVPATDAPYCHNWSTRVHTFPEGNIVLQNQHIRASFCRRTMQLISLVDLHTGEELCGKTPTGFFSLIDEDTNKGMSSWRVGNYMQCENLNISCHVHLKSCSTQGIRQWASYELTFRDGSILRVKIILDDNSRSLEYETSVDFRLCGASGKSIPRLDFTLPIGYQTELCRCGVPFGLLDRPAADHDIPALSYVAALPDASGKSMLALMSDSKYGYRFYQNALSLGLLRGSYEPDPTPEIEPTSFRLAISVLPAFDSAALLQERSIFLNRPIYCSARPGTGYLPTEGQLLRVEGNMCVCAVKTPEDGAGLIVRLVNETSDAAACSVTLCRPIASATLTDAEEHTLHALDVTNGNTIALDVPAMSVRTLQLSF